MSDSSSCGLGIDILNVHVSCLVLKSLSLVIHNKDLIKHLEVYNIKQQDTCFILGGVGRVDRFFFVFFFLLFLLVLTLFSLFIFF